MPKHCAEFGVEIISTGGTARSLREVGVEVTEVSDVTNFPEMMDGRVKTLHPKIHGAFLALRDNEQHVASMKEHGIEPIDLVVVNLYPFEETIAKEDVSLDEAVENIDIGGPAMIRSASKNWRDVAVVTDARLYESIVAEIKGNRRKFESRNSPTACRSGLHANGELRSGDFRPISLNSFHATISNFSNRSIRWKI